MSDLDDMGMVDEHGQCRECGRYVGEGEYQCSVPGGISCAIGEAANEPPDDDDVPHGPEGDVGF